MTSISYNGIALALAPIFILIATGAISRYYLFRDPKIWDTLDSLNFKLLIPSLIVGSLSKTDFHAISGWDIIAIIAATLCVLTLVLYAIYWLLVPKLISPSSFTSVFQTSTRWNASIAIVVIEFLFDPIAITIVALIMVALMPLVNVINIVMLVRVLDAETSSIRMTIVKVIRNPIIVGCLVGIVISASGIQLWSPIQTGLDTLGQAAVGTILLGLGAGLNFHSFIGEKSLIALSSFLKLFLMPAFVFFIGTAFGLTPDILSVATIAAAVPTATNGYIVAKEMGGDAPLYASACTTQTVLSLATLPLWIFTAPYLIEIFQQ